MSSISNGAIVEGEIVTGCIDCPLDGPSHNSIVTDVTLLNVKSCTLALREKLVAQFERKDMEKRISLE